MSGCRRQRVAEAVAVANPTLPLPTVVAVIDAVVTHPAVLRDLAAALDADPGRPVGRRVRRPGPPDLPSTCPRRLRAGSPTVRWPKGTVCDPCYTAALRRRGTCTACGQLLSHSPATAATTPESAPPGGRWLFPGHLPGRPLTTARLGERLRKIGINAQAAQLAQTRSHQP